MLKKFLLSLLVIAAFIPIPFANAADVPDFGDVSKDLVFRGLQPDNSYNIYVYKLDSVGNDNFAEAYVKTLLAGYPFKQVGYEKRDSGRKGNTVEVWTFAYTGSKNVSAFSRYDSAYSGHLTLKRYRVYTRGHTEFAIRLAHGLTYPGNYSPSANGGNGKEDCWECRGSGKCKNCGGSGRVDKWGGDRTYRNLTCTYCGGTGKCRSCYGTGKR